jgi:hypothetical protein
MGYLEICNPNTKHKLNTYWNMVRKMIASAPLFTKTDSTRRTQACDLLTAPVSVTAFLQAGAPVEPNPGAPVSAPHSYQPVHNEALQFSSTKNHNKF